MTDKPVMTREEMLLAVVVGVVVLVLVLCLVGLGFVLGRIT